MTNVTTTQKIKELAEKAYKQPWEYTTYKVDEYLHIFSSSNPSSSIISGDDIQYSKPDLTYLLCAVNNAAQMAELIDEMGLLIVVLYSLCYEKFKDDTNKSIKRQVEELAKKVEAFQQGVK